MYNSNKRKMMLLLGTVIFLSIFMVFMNRLNGEEARLNRKIQSMGENSFSISLYNEGVSFNENTHVIQEVMIDAWLDEEKNKLYFFMPSVIAEGSYAGWKYVFGGCDKVNIDGTLYESGDAFVLSEGEHILTTENGETFCLEVLHSENMASMFVEMEEGSLDELRESKESIATASFQLFDEEGMLDGNGVIEDIHTRGNLSFTETDKKSFSFKLKQEDGLLGMYKSRKWLLTANAFDDTLSRNYLVSQLAKKLGMKYVPATEYVDLYIDGEYQGNYQLSEKVEIGEGRIPIRNLEDETYALNVEEDVTTSVPMQVGGAGDTLLKYADIEYLPKDNSNGYLLELDMIHRFEDEVSGFLSSGHQPVVMKSPEYAGLEQVRYVADLYQGMEDALNTSNGYNEVTGKYFYDYMNMTTFVQKYLIDEVTKNTDSSLSSFYMYIPDVDGRLYAGPIWDYDKALGADEERDGHFMKDPEGLYAAEDIELAVCADREHSLYYLLCGQEAFAAEYKKMYFEVMRDAALDMADTLVMQNAERIKSSAVMDVIRWGRFEGIDNQNMVEQIYLEKQEEIVIFLKDRVKFLDRIWK